VNVPYLLVNPPVTDPTAPYHSIPYLVGATRAAGFPDCECVDANLEAFEYLARPEQCAIAIEHARRIARQRPRSRAEEVNLRLALSAEGLDPDAVRGAISVLKDPELFYHWPTYRQAGAVLQRWCNLIAMQMPPGVLDGFSMHPRAGVNLCSSADLGDRGVIDAIARPFEGYLSSGFTTHLRSRPWRLVGFSVNFTSQLPIALRMARLVREECPEAVIVFGGTETCDVVKGAASPAVLWGIFADVDLIVPGEGERPLVAILDAIRRGDGFDQLAGVLTRSSGPGLPRLRYEDVGALPPPAYDVWNWDRYWSPEPVVLYSPTRGCYWNKCTFCDYGLNTDRPTSPSRERPLPSVLSDLAAVSVFAKAVYFAVDAMSPRYLRGLAAALAEAPFQLKWSAELRLERTFPRRSVGELLSRAGCVAVSFGYESGTQRILNLIDKGVCIDDVPAILAELARNGIGAQMMGFTGFPSETEQEARATYEFLHQNASLWTTAGIGEFVLTRGSIVARRASDFGVELLASPGAEDIHRYLPWADTGSEVAHWPDEPDSRIPAKYRTMLGRTPFSRVMVGGTDSAHTILYFARYGRRLVPEDSGTPKVQLASSSTADVPVASVDSLTTLEDLKAEVRVQSARGSGATSSSLSPWLASPGGTTPGSQRALVLANGALVSLPDGLDLSADTPLSRAFRILVEATAKESPTCAMTA
jgi:anaerobic magnesium-protoporphyrin IX monomethyl ester cyclase